ncbi:hypothetical protein JCM9492_10990 [Aquifex pyrophilus]
MRVPAYEVKVNGNTIKALSISIDQGRKNYVFRARIEMTKEYAFSLGDAVSIEFFEVPLIRGQVLKITERPHTRIYEVSVRTPRIPPTYIANKPYRKSDLKRKVIANGNATTLFSLLLAQHGYTLYVDSPPPIVCYGREIEGDIVQAMADYFRDFAPIVSVDAVNKVVYLLFEGLPRTYTIPDRAIFDYEITQEERDASTITIANRRESLSEKENNEECQSGYAEIETENTTTDTKTKNVYRINLCTGEIRLVRTETETYGEIPSWTYSDVNWNASEPYYLARDILTKGRIWEGKRGITSKTITEYFPDGMQKTTRYGWVPIPFNLVVSKVLSTTTPFWDIIIINTTIYKWDIVSESASYAETETKDLNEKFRLKRTKNITIEYDYQYSLVEGGFLSRRDALNYRNLLHGDVQKKIEKKVSVYETISVENKQTGETQVLETKQWIENDGLAGTMSMDAEKKILIPYVSERIEVSSEPVSVPGRKEEKTIVHEDLDRQSIRWASERIRSLYQKHSVKGRITLPLLAVKVGEKVQALGRTWLIEGFSHSISGNTATTTLYVREA